MTRENMIQPLSKAPYDVPLVFESVLGESLLWRFKRLGLVKGDIVTRMGGVADISPVRVRTPVGEVVLAAGMAAKVIVHHDDGHKTPVSEMLSGETGHVEGLVCGTALEKGLGLLGIHENDPIQMVRRIPPMDYIALVKGRRIVLPEGAAAKLWGEAQGRETQFVVVGTGKEFTIKALLGGQRVAHMLGSMGLAPGVTLSLDSVRLASSEGRRAKDQTIVSTQSGLRLYLRRDQENSVMVSVALNREPDRQNTG